MKKAHIIIATIVAAAVIAVIGIIFINSRQSANIETEPEASNQSESIKTVSQVALDSKQYVNSLNKINISGTDDYFMITKEVKWEVPEHKKGETVSFSIAIPYTITVDEAEYKGTYELNDSSYSTDDKNPKYNFSVTNLTKNGEIEVLITEK